MIHFDLISVKFFAQIIIIFFNLEVLLKVVKCLITVKPKKEMKTWMNTMKLSTTRLLKICEGFFGVAKFL